MQYIRFGRRAQRRRADLEQRIMERVESARWVRFDAQTRASFGVHRPELLLALASLALQEKIFILEDAAGDFVALGPEEFAWGLRSRAGIPMQAPQKEPEEDWLMLEVAEPAPQAAPIRQTLPMRPREPRHKQGVPDGILVAQ